MGTSKPRVFKDVQNAGCATCGEQWIGRVADDQARDHAKATGHLVIITVLTRETHNAPASDFAPAAEPIEAPRSLPPIDLPLTAYAQPRSAVSRVSYAGIDRSEVVVASRFHKGATP